MKGVSVGVNVTGVDVSVANRFWVGIRVTVGCGVRVSVGGKGVGEMTSSRNGDRLEHPLKTKTRRRIGTIFFMKSPLKRKIISG